MGRRLRYVLLFVALFGCDDGGDSAGGQDDATAMSDDGMMPVNEMGVSDGGPAPDQGPSGTGVLEVDPTTLEFERLAVGARAEQQLTLSNAGDGPLSVALDDLAAPFSSSRRFPLQIPAGAARPVIFTFAPETAGPVEQVITFRPDSGEAQSVTLTGSAATPEAELLTASLDFGVTEPGVAASDAVVIRNASAEIALTLISAGGVEAPFSVPMGQLPVNLAPGEEGRVVVQLNPAADGDFAQTLLVGTNGGTFEVPVTARVVTPGDMEVTGVEPAWVVAGVPTEVIVHGGPFPLEIDAVTIGDVALSEVERVDEWHVRALVPDTLEVGAGEALALDVRIESGPRFGLAAASVVVTPDPAVGRALNLEALRAGPIGPEGNPWRLEVDVVPGDVPVTIAPGTVILAAADQRLRFAAPVQIGGEGAPVVFSATAPIAGGWSGLNFDLTEGPSTLQAVVVEYAGAGEAAVVIERDLGLTDIIIRRSAGDALRIEDGARLAFYSGEITDAEGDAVVMAPASGIFRFQRSRVRGVQWPMRADIGVFGRLPLGAGHDWAANAYDAIGIGGSLTSEIHLPNQPAGLTYRVRADIRVSRGGTLSFSSGAPLILDGVIEIRGGTLVLPAGLQLRAEGAGTIIADGGTFTAQGTAENPVVIGARVEGAEGEPSPWDGVRLEAVTQANIAHLTVLGAGRSGDSAVGLPRSAVEIVGLAVEDSSAAALTLSGPATLTEARFGRNASGIEINGGRGAIEGTSTDAPAVSFSDPALCAEWNLDGLLDGAGEPVMTDCP